MSEEEKVEDGSVEVVIEEGTSAEAPAPEREAPKEEPAAQAKADKDLEEHSESVRKRIDKLTYKVREAERREQAALEYARGLKGQLETYQERASRLDKSLVQEFDNRLKTQEKMIREELRRAIDEGNIDGQIEAQSALAALAVENDRLRQSRLRREQEEVQRQAVAARPVPQAAPVPQAPQPDPKARSWAERNEWFGNDRAMTATAYAIHADLVEVEGFDPSSDEYYQELDNRIRSEFPHKFKPASQSNAAPRPQSMVAPARSTVKSGSTKVKLTESQIRVAKALGVSLEEYARHTRMQQQG